MQHKINKLFKTRSQYKRQNKQQTTKQAKRTSMRVSCISDIEALHTRRLHEF